MLITHANLVTWGEPNQILENYGLLVEDGVIQHIGKQADMDVIYPEIERLDACGQYVFPGNICAHTHFYGAFARGLAIPGNPPHDFLTILSKLWWPLDQALDAEAVKYSALVCLIDAIRHGTTALVDHHASPNSIPGSLDILAEAVQMAGLRAVLCYEVTDRNGAAGAQAGIDENIRMINRVRQNRRFGDKIAATFGLHASLTLSDATLEKCREIAPEGTGFHIHVAESEADEVDSLTKHGARVVERLNRFGVLGPDSLLVHAVHVNNHEIDLLGKTHTWVTHQPRSNMNNAVGIGDVEAMKNAGVKVCLGNDGFSNAMWEEWKTAYLVHKVWRGDPRSMPATEVIEMGVRNNALLMQHYFPQAIFGQIKPGAVADLIFVDYHPFTPLSEQNLPWHIMFGFHESMITTTIVGGKVLMHQRQLLNLDEAEIAARACESALRVWDRYRFYAPT